ncbi:uncharacterized protein GGS22DRAFT_192365 [Annulohypoxylon maeteangense]|uniref:uncharacterized protein n=1 Tax=Annulohypoxylon maeteangense TaxID=1927788 RepID=UPI002008D238|nr:uncharacterized protein GGS22DRAFT_192365 [Annulohypoxylon maeteangense]KAI0881277.1 hypothetical protein GGS22DRAFT_192365 [Annulohypoxylon maeteangense]
MATIVIGDESLIIDFDGFIFEDAQIDPSVSTALTTPLQGVDAGEATVYNNALNLMTTALLFKQEWIDNTPESKTRFINAVTRHWGLTTANATSFLIDMLFSARRRVFGCWEQTPSQVRKTFSESPETVAIIHDILRATKVPTFVQGIHNPVAPHLKPYAVICKDLVRLVQGDILGLGFAEDEINTQQITNIIGRMLSPGHQLLVQRTIEEAQAPGQICPIIVSIRDDMVRKLRTAVSNAYCGEQRIVNVVAELAAWKPRISRSYGTLYQPDVTNGQKRTHHDAEQVEITPTAKQASIEVEDDNTITLPMKREHGGGGSPPPKRVRENTDEDGNIPITVPRQCVPM